MLGYAKLRDKVENLSEMKHDKQNHLFRRKYFKAEIGKE